jgi:protein-ribulosamine 3-kinase
VSSSDRIVVELEARLPELVRGSGQSTFRFESSSGTAFVKTGPGAHVDFSAEAAALRELADANALRVPEVLAQGSSGEFAYLLLEYLEFEPASERSERLLGERLAQLHRVAAGQFGWRIDNTIGVTPQRNTPANDWLTFWRDSRLLPQLLLACDRGMSAASFDRGLQLAKRLPEFFAGHDPQPSLLHGDLWGGNWGTLAAGEPVIFDPATYYGDRETDLAMTTLFGGFSAEFYAAYESAWPRATGFATREVVYNLYRVLNHFNLFGGEYLQQAERMIDVQLGE